ncbi:MAG: glycogen-binding domain-containing protein [Gemmatimonadales bacterium]
MSRHARNVGTFAFAIALASSQAAAQSPVLRVVVGGGQSTDLRGARAAAVSIAPSVHLFPSAGSSAWVYARGTRFDGAVWSASGGAGLSMRTMGGGPLGLILTASGDATRASWGDTWIQGDALPAIEARLGSLSLYGGARGALARHSPASDPRLGPLPSPGGAGTTSRSTAGPAFGATLRLSGAGARELIRIRYREEHLRPDGLAVSERAATIELGRGSVTAAGSLGRQSAPDESRTFGGVQLTVGIVRGVALMGSFDSYAANRLAGTPAGRSLSLGLSLSTGGVRAPRSLPRPAGAPAPRPGYVRLSLRAPSARAVEVAGDWTSWKPVPLTRAANGVWYVDQRINPGEYRYAFRVDGTAWTVPDGVAAVNDGFGGRSAWLFVKETGSNEAKPETLKEER